MLLKINNTFIDNAEDLDIVMSMYNLLEYIDNYFMVWETLWNSYRDEVNDNDDDENDDDGFRVSNSKTTRKSFEYKANRNHTR